MFLEYRHHDGGTPKTIRQGCAPNPANASHSQIKNLSAFAVPELVKQKIAGAPLGSDFVIDDGTGRTLGMVVGVTQ
ncbi:hypothetical protein AB4M58_23810 [Escherichia coli]